MSKAPEEEEPSCFGDSLNVSCLFLVSAGYSRIIAALFSGANPKIIDFFIETNMTTPSVLDLFPLGQEIPDSFKYRFSDFICKTQQCLPFLIQGHLLEKSGACLGVGVSGPEGGH